MKADEETLVEVQRNGRFQQKKLQALEELVKAYERYRQACQEEVRLQTEDKRLQEQLAANLTRQKRLQTDHDELQDVRGFRQEQLREQQKESEQYASFEPRSLLEKDLEDMESEFQALSRHISMERQQLEKNIARERQSFNRIDEDLLAFSKANGLISSDYETICYDSYRLDGLKEAQIQLALAIEHLREQQHQCEINMTKIETRLSYELRQLHEQLDVLEPRARELVTVADFDALLTTKQHQQHTTTKTLQSVQNRQGLYQENLSALAEFAHLPLGETLAARQDLTLLNREQLDCHRGQLVRDYRAVLTQGRDERENLSRLTEKVMRRECYQEDFFHKPLLTLADLTAKPQDYLTQLAITCASYEQLLQKLAVDIQLIEKEKEKVLDLFLRYLSEVHQQLGLIDKNSTIRVKERSLKMLRLELPDWAENEAVYTAKLKNYLENITEQCLILLADNQNVEDLLSRQIALRQLYDAIVGIGNIEIKLYKIEAQREYPIRWADVARNSGGEGFLSAFVILSSLLSFLRRKESDLFGEREESKVLVMDNPFAQTNAAHLLIPMMDMAKKTHTQLICLSGIGGDAIYGRFDNIYVLTPVQSGLQRELSYLRGEHVKGETLISAQIQTEDMEQMTLF